MPGHPEKDAAFYAALAGWKQDLRSPRCRDELIAAMRPLIWPSLYKAGISETHEGAEHTVLSIAFRCLRRFGRAARSGEEMSEPLHYVRRAAGQSAFADYCRMRRRNEGPPREDDDHPDAAMDAVAKQAATSAGTDPSAGIFNKPDTAQMSRVMAGFAKLGARQRWFLEQHVLKERDLPELINELFEAALAGEPGGREAATPARRAALFTKARNNIYSYNSRALPSLKKLVPPLTQEG